MSGSPEALLTVPLIIHDKKQMYMAASMEMPWLLTTSVSGALCMHAVMQMRSPLHDRAKVISGVSIQLIPRVLKQLDQPSPTPLSISSSGHYTTMPSVPINLTTLSAHSIFSSGSGKEKQDDWELVDAPDDDLVGTKSSRMILRDKDLIIASGSQVRMCSLAGEGWKVDGDVEGSYKVCSTLTFDRPCS
jgi:hypothetical protein